jgi:hypothetical protein
VDEGGVRPDGRERLLLFFAIPLRTYHNVFFRLKAVLLLLPRSTPGSFHNGGMYRRLEEWDNAAVTRVARGSRRVFAGLWVAIIFSGGMMPTTGSTVTSPSLPSSIWLRACVRNGRRMLLPYFQAN